MRSRKYLASSSFSLVLVTVRPVCAYSSVRRRIKIVPARSTCSESHTGSSHRYRLERNLADCGYTVSCTIRIDYIFFVWRWWSRPLLNRDVLISTDVINQLTRSIDLPRIEQHLLVAGQVQKAVARDVEGYRSFPSLAFQPSSLVYRCLHGVG